MAVGLDQLILPARQLEHFQQFGDAAFDAVAFLSVQSGDEPQKLRAGELVVHEGAVGDEPEPHLGRQRIDVDVVAAQQHASLRGPQDPGDHPERRRLAGPVRPKAAVEDAARHVQADVVHRDEAAVELGQVLQADHSTSSFSRPISGTSSTCRASPPMAIGTCAASAGNWSNVGSTATQSVR